MQPVYILLDTSGSMRGEPIAAVNVGLSAMLTSLRSRSGLAEKVRLTVMTFDADVKTLIDAELASQTTLPQLTVPSSGPTLIGEALEAFLIKHAGQTKTDDTLPAMLFIMTDGSPTDLQIFEEAIPKVKALNLSRIVAFAAGPKARSEPLQPLTDEVVTLDTLSTQTFTKIFDQVATIIGAGAAAPSIVPPPPDQIDVEF